MSNKFDKNTKCQYCGDEMTAKYRSKKFCSSKCRVYYNRENVTVTDKKESIPDSKIQLKEKIPPTNDVVLDDLQRQLEEKRNEILKNFKKR